MGGTLKPFSRQALEPFPEGAEPPPPRKFTPEPDQPEPAAGPAVIEQKAAPAVQAQPIHDPLNAVSPKTAPTPPKAKARIAPGPKPTVQGTANDPHNPYWLGQELLDAGRLTEGEFVAAINSFRAYPTESFGAALVRGSFATAADIAQLTAEHYKLEYVDIPQGAIEPELIRKMRHLRAAHHCAVLYREDPGQLTIAVADPTRYTEREAKADFPGKKIVFVIAAKAAIESAVAEAHAPEKTESSPKDLLKQIISDAAADDASDIHIDPRPASLAIRRRIDGDVIFYRNYTEAFKTALILAVKNLADLHTADRFLPLDGKAPFQVGAIKYNLRISTAPTIHGENAVIRLLNETKNLRSLEELGLDPDQVQTLLRYASVRDGITYVTGPTGSGKTTLLSALMRKSAKANERVFCIENPVEYVIPEYTQMEVNEKVGLTWAICLRCALRQDPDVILIGETRDNETAGISMNAALTGHRCFSTLHTANAPAAVTRLIEMEVDPYLIAGTVKTVVATRLVKTLCKTCSEPMREPNLSYLRDTYGDGNWRAPVGCSNCKNTGFKGRTLIAEIYPLDNEETTRLILQKVEATVFKEHLEKLGKKTMRQHGIEKAMAGITTMDEVLREVSRGPVDVPSTPPLRQKPQTQTQASPIHETHPSE